MTSMRNLLGAALLGASAMAGTAYADEPSFSGNVALTSDYHFRGVSQSSENPAVQGGFDYGYGLFYAGVWASSIDFGVEGTTEIDLYAGFTPTLGPVSLDVGVIGYFYPGLEDGGTEADYVEFALGAEVAPADGLSLGASLYYSPEFTFEGGEALYLEGSASLAVSDTFTLSGAVGAQSVDAAAFFIDGTGGADSYTTWNLGGTISAYGFDFDVRYVDTDLDWNLAEERVIFTLSRSL